MVKVGKFTGEIHVGGKPLKEYYAVDSQKPIPALHLADAYVEVSYETDVSFQRETHDFDPYGEPIVNNFYVTPWTIKVRNDATVEVGVRAFVDGQKIYDCIVPSGAEKEIQGVQAQVGHYSSAESQLLFARPRLPKPRGPNEPAKPALTSEQIKNLCLCKLEFFEVKRWSETVTPTTRSLADDDRRAKASAHLNPIDKEQAKLKGTTCGTECGAIIKADSSSSSSSGKSNAKSSGSLAPYTAHYYKLLDGEGQRLGEVSIRYRQRHDLYAWGFFAPKQEAGEIEEIDVPKEKKVKRQQE